MKESILSVRVDEKDKKDFEVFCNNTGMNISTAINLFIKTVLREGRIPFQISTKDYKKYVNEKIKEAENELLKGGKTYKAEEVLEIIKEVI